jgi:hypothetical protein
MNMREIADNIYNMNVSSSEKIFLLEQNIQDCMNEMDAQDQNMRPELRHRLSEGLRKSKDYVRTLKLSKK